MFSRWFYKKCLNRWGTVSQEAFLGNYQAMLKEIYDKLNIAIFPIDSTTTGIRGATSGRVSNPRAKFLHLKSYYTGNGGDPKFDKAFKICIMHHHPLPTYTKPGDEIAEPLLLLGNPHEVLSNIANNKINLVLHGHKHECSDSIYNPNPREMASFAVSACGSSCKVSGNGERNYVRFHTISQGQSCSVETLYSLRNDHSFQEESKYAFDLIAYGDARKRRAQTFTNPASCIKRTRVKSKVLKLYDTGDADVYIWYDKIKWKQEAKRLGFPVKERLSADMGRIIGGDMGIGYSRDHTKLKSWRREDFAQSRDLSEPEHYEITVKPEEGAGFSAEPAASCAISYGASNLFSLNTDEFKRVYGKPKTSKCQEAASIFVDTPTDLLVLTIRFPEKHFPDRSFKVEAVKKQSGDQNLPGGLMIINKDYECDELETDFLDKKHSLLVRPDLHECELIIRYPQPDLLYVIRWDVPDKPARIHPPMLKNMFADQEAFKNFYDELSTRTFDFYKNMLVCLMQKKLSGSSMIETEQTAAVREYENFIEKFLSEEMFIVVFKPDEERCELQVETAACPAMFRNARPLPIGRGPAGVTAKRLDACHYLKSLAHSDDNNILYTPVEHIIENLNPEAVQCFPIHEGNHLHAVVSLVFFQNDRMLSSLIEDTGTRRIMATEYLDSLSCMAHDHFSKSTPGGTV